MAIDVTATRMTNLRRFMSPAGPLVVIVAITMLVTGCGSSGAGEAEALDAQTAESVTEESTETTITEESDENIVTEESDETDVLYPDVVAATATPEGDGIWTFSATLSSPYDSAARYADAWRVVGPDGEVYGVRELAHDHASEQPFTRSQSGIAIPDDVETVVVEGRDQISGWGGATVEVELDR